MTTLDLTYPQNQNTILDIKNLNFAWAVGEYFLWENPVTFEIKNGEKVRITGTNTSTLFKLILADQIVPTRGVILREGLNVVFYIDQNYNFLNIAHEFGRAANILQVAQEFNHNKTSDDEIKTILDKFGFNNDTLFTAMESLSIGERIRLTLACLSILKIAPDLLILDAPACHSRENGNLSTNPDTESACHSCKPPACHSCESRNLLATALKEYQGTLIITSDDDFIKSIGGTTKTINLL
jgi:ATPase subunit of ABC transporter with duplicated ATPase domains